MGLQLRPILCRWERRLRQYAAACQCDPEMAPKDEVPPIGYMQLPLASLIGVVFEPQLLEALKQLVLGKNSDRLRTLSLDIEATGAEMAVGLEKLVRIFGEGSRVHRLLKDGEGLPPDERNSLWAKVAKQGAAGLSLQAKKVRVQQVVK